MTADRLMTALAWKFPEADQFMRGELDRDGSYQGRNLTVALQYVSDWRTACDVGAHVGTWSRCLSERFQRVIAIEPSPDTFACLVENMRAFDCQNVECLQMAAGAQPGFVSMALDSKEVKRANTGARYVRPGGEIRRETIDSLELPVLGFLKVDVEGSELAVLQGAEATIRRCRPVIIFEAKNFGVHRYGQHKKAVPHFLSAVGYRHLADVSRDQVWGPA